MSDFSDSLALSASALRAQARRLRHVSDNIANADTLGFRRKIVPFEQETRVGSVQGEVRLGRINLDRSDLARIYDPSSPLADQTGHYDGSNVDLVIEIADAREAQRSYEANLKMFDQSRQMSASLLDLLRR